MNKKRILIIGKNSYIGENIKKYLNPLFYEVSEFDIKNKVLVEKDLIGIDVVIHVAAIVHQKKIKDYTKYEDVNVKLPLEIAKLAKKNSIKQFIFLSSMSVYGVGKSLKGNIIDENTKCNPKTLYGRSKYEAEESLRLIESNNFKVSIIRPANVYGKNCRGNYITTFLKIVKLFPVLPDVYDNVKQGMIYVDNLCELIKIVIDTNSSGIFPAQDIKGVSSLEIMQAICSKKKLKKRSSKFLGRIFLILRIPPVTKLFGGVVYDEKYAINKIKNYQKVNFIDGINKSI